MNREIKFRAWDNINKEWLKQTNKRFQINGGVPDVISFTIKKFN